MEKVQAFHFKGGQGVKTGRRGDFVRCCAIGDAGGLTSLYLSCHSLLQETVDLGSMEVAAG